LRREASKGKETKIKKGVACAGKQRDKKIKIKIKKDLIRTKIQ
jgi:hypothetical protein